MKAEELASFHASLASRGRGAKDWANTFTEVEHLGNGKFAASTSTGHRVFKDKAAGKWLKHKLTDERPTKGYVLIQSAKCCVEVYPYYAMYFDVDHTEVRLNEEGWVVQRLFKAPDEWRDVDAYNPVMAVEETENSIVVIVSYTTDYGTLILKYIQRDGAALKHDIAFKNASGSTETFRVLQRWAGIVGAKCNGKDFPVDVAEPFLAFHRADKPQREFTIAENLWGMVFNPDGSEKGEKCLQRPVKIESHAAGMKADFVYGNWVLAPGESLEVDPDTATLNNPNEDGGVTWDGSIYVRDNTDTKFVFGNRVFPIWVRDRRAYCEWDISSLSGATLTANPVFKYHGQQNTATDGEINPIAAQPSTATDANLYADIATGTAYVNPFDVVTAINQQVVLGAAAKSDLQAAITASQSWFAIGFQSPADEGGGTEYVSGIYSEEYATPTPPPTLYVEYTLAAGGLRMIPSLKGHMGYDLKTRGGKARRRMF